MSGDDLPTAQQSASELPDRSSAFFSALLTEQFVLQSVRGVTVSEASSRASLYMLTLSSALVAYGFLADTHVAAAYLGVVLPIVFVLGIFTWERLVQTALENIIAVAAIQRIRRYYATLLPGADYFFPQPTDRTAVHELIDIGTRSSRRAVVFTTSSAILTVNCIVAGAGIALAAREAGLGTPASVALGVLGGFALFIALASYQLRRFRRVNAAVAAASLCSPPWSSSRYWAHGETPEDPLAIARQERHVLRRSVWNVPVRTALRNCIGE